MCEYTLKLAMLYVEDDPPKNGDVVLVYSENRNINNGWEIIKWRPLDEHGYSVYFPLKRLKKGKNIEHIDYVIPGDDCRPFDFYEGWEDDKD